MLITWDESKRRANFRQHGLDFADAPAVFAQYTHTHEDTRYHYNERRYSTTGLLGELVVVIVHTEKEGHSCHLIPTSNPARGAGVLVTAH